MNRIYSAFKLAREASDSRLRDSRQEVTLKHGEELAFMRNHSGVTAEITGHKLQYSGHHARAGVAISECDDRSDKFQTE